MHSILKNKEYFLDPTAWWHVHTSYTDGVCGVEEIFRLARERGAGFIGFIEHIREKPSYDVNELIAEIKMQAERHQIKSDVGFEAKLKPDGGLDCPADLQEGFVCLAEHGWPQGEDKKPYLKALLTAMRGGAASAWVHPGLLAQRRGWSFEEDEVGELLQTIKDNRIVLENNYNHRTLSGECLQIIQENEILYFNGLDFHRPDDILLMDA